MTLSGTSMAAPAVAGVGRADGRRQSAALGRRVRAVLEFTAQHLPDANLMTQGAGYLNAPAPSGSPRCSSRRPSSASVWLKSRRGLPASYDEISSEQVSWGKHVIWGDRVLLGDSAYLHLAAWNDNIVWGQDDNIVWGQGDNIVWGQDNIVWGQDNIVWGQDALENIVWGQCDTAQCDYVIRGDNIVWGHGQHRLGPGPRATSSGARTTSSGGRTAWFWGIGPITPSVASGPTP